MLLLQELLGSVEEFIGRVGWLYERSGEVEASTLSQLLPVELASAVVGRSKVCDPKIKDGIIDVTAGVTWSSWEFRRRGGESVGGAALADVCSSVFASAAAGSWYDINAKDGSVDEAARLTRSSVEFRMRGLAVACEGDA